MNGRLFWYQVGVDARGLSNESQFDDHKAMGVQTYESNRDQG